jgi:very-short-patch-repair endonuclease
MRARLAKGSLRHARQLRQDATGIEKRLWNKMRELNRELGCKFRRQVPFRNYILDFTEHGAALVIELDGSQHGFRENRVRDEQRDAILADEGYKVLRFWNQDVVENFDGVVDAIVMAWRERSPYPKNPKDFSTSPQGGGVS